VIVRTLPGQDVLLRQPRLVATGQFQGTASRAGFPGVYTAGGRFALGFTTNQITSRKSVKRYADYTTTITFYKNQQIEKYC